MEQLSSDKIELRLGGIYTLERISRESPNDYWTIMETLTAFVRERARWKEPSIGASETMARFYESDQPTELPKGPPTDIVAAALAVIQQGPPTDIAAVLAVIQRRGDADRAREEKEGWKLNFNECNFRAANLNGAHFERANLNGAHFEGAFLIGAHFERAFLIEAHFEGAILTEAHLEGAGFVGAHLEGAFLIGAHFERASLNGAHLEGANLMASKGLTQAQLDQACGDKDTKLDSPLRIKPCKPQ